MSCAPGIKKRATTKTCLTKPQLIDILKNHSVKTGSKLPGGVNIERLSEDKLLKTVHHNLYPKCKDDHRCWAEMYNRNAMHVFRPRMPPDWKINRYEWLSNHDILDCLSQYADSYPFYRVVGVFPSDFAEKRFGTCLKEAACSVKLAPDGIYGIVLNTDLSTGPGKHWVSLLICTDRSKSQFGFAYYDSVGRPMISGVRRYIDEIIARNPDLGDAPIHDIMADSRIRHQNQDTECGMFCLIHHHVMISSYEKDRLEPMAYAKLDLADEVANMKREYMFYRSD